MKAVKTELTHWMRTQRIQHGLRQSDAAALFHVSLPTYQRWEQGHLEYAELDRTKKEQPR
jgi:DNA-binding transcriptional regulator YiaG